MDFSIISLFLKYSLYIIFLNPFIYCVLELFYPPFTNIKPRHKKYYVVSNIIKSIVLLKCIIPAIYLLWNIYYEDRWDIDRVKKLSTIYAVVDTVALLMVPKLQKNTKIHHLSVFALYIVCMWYEFEKNTIADFICVYGVWSAFSYLVNLYLAVRVFIPEKTVFLQKLCSYSFTIYISCCSINWYYQFTNLWNMMVIHKMFTLPYVLYTFLLINLICDDCILLKYLYDHKQPTYIFYKKL